MGGRRRRGRSDDLGRGPRAGARSPEPGAESGERGAGGGRLVSGKCGLSELGALPFPAMEKGAAVYFLF